MQNDIATWSSVRCEWGENKIPKPWDNVSEDWENGPETLKCWCLYNKQEMKWEPNLKYWCCNSWSRWEPPWGFPNSLEQWARWKNSRAIAHHVKNTFPTFFWNDIVRIILQFTHGNRKRKRNEGKLVKFRMNFNIKFFYV